MGRNGSMPLQERGICASGYVSSQLLSCHRMWFSEVRTDLKSINDGRSLDYHHITLQSAFRRCSVNCLGSAPCFGPCFLYNVSQSRGQSLFCPVTAALHPHVTEWMSCFFTALDQVGNGTSWCGQNVGKCKNF